MEPPSADLARTTDDALEAQITELAAHIHAATYRLLTLIREFDRRGAWAAQGLRSCAHWLNWKCGIVLGAAREKVRVARDSLPMMKWEQQARKTFRIGDAADDR